MAAIFSIRCNECGYIDESIASSKSLRHARAKAKAKGWTQIAASLPNVDYCPHCSGRRVRAHVDPAAIEF